MCAQKLSFDYAHTLHTVRIVHNAHSVHRSRVQKGKSCDCINFVRATDPACGSGGMFVQAARYMRIYQCAVAGTHLRLRQISCLITSLIWQSTAMAGLQP